MKSAPKPVHKINNKSATNAMYDIIERKKAAISNNIAVLATQHGKVFNSFMMNSTVMGVFVHTAVLTTVTM